MMRFSLRQLLWAVTLAAPAAALVGYWVRGATDAFAVGAAATTVGVACLVAPLGSWLAARRGPHHATLCKDMAPLAVCGAMAGALGGVLFYGFIRSRFEAWRIDPRVLGAVAFAGAASAVGVYWRCRRTARGKKLLE